VRKIVLALLMAAVLGGVLWADAAANKQEHSNIQYGHSLWVNETGPIVPLQYGPGFKVELKLGEPAASLKLMRTVRFDGDEGLQGTALSFYETAEGYFMAFLTDVAGLRYHLKNAPGMEVEVRKLDSTDPVKAIVLSKVDTEYPTKMVIRKNTSSGVWEAWDFQHHLVQMLNLDRDGEMEWVGFDSGAVPPMTELHRWNQERQDFETANAEGSVLSEGGWMDEEIPAYSYLFRENGQWLLEIGQEYRFRYYRYEHGTLHEVELPDNGSSRANRIRSHEIH